MIIRGQDLMLPQNVPIRFGILQLHLIMSVEFVVQCLFPLSNCYKYDVIVEFLHYPIQCAGGYSE